MRKIKKFKEKGKPVEKLEKELAYCSGDLARPDFKTGAAANDTKTNKRR